MDGYYVFSSSPCHREEPKFIVSANSDADAPEVMSSDSTLQVPKWEPTQSPPISSEVVPNRERSCMKRTTICGLPSTVFVLLVILAIAIVAAAVGGGLGGSIAVKNARSEGLAEGQASCSSKGDTSADSTTTASTPISSSTTASETPFIPPDDVVLALDCPSLTMDTTSIQLGSRRNDFRFECGVDLTSTSNINIVAVMAYSLDHCLRACVAYNDYASGDGCVAITFLADLSSLNQHRGNCYLKSERGEKKQFDASQRNVTISAVLKDD